MHVKVYLVVTGRGDCRLTKRRPTLDWDEIAFPITVEVPSGWGKIYDDHGAELSFPEPPLPDSLVVGEHLEASV